VLAKVEEEIGEIRAELSAGRKNRARVREELGDLLFALVNMARHLGIDAEDALQRANTKFGQRFKQIERRVRQQGKRLEHCTLEELDGIWEDNKRRQRSRRK
jgi:ATP diphosphatase